jgi:prophage regulatory protein
MDDSNNRPESQWPGYMRVSEVAKVCGIGKSTVWAWQRAGRFPRCHHLSPRIAVWHAEDIRLWLKNPSTWMQSKESSPES